MISIFKPWYDEREEKAVIQVMRSGWVGLGPKTQEFENKFSEKIGAKFSVNCNSATAALQIAARLLGVSPGDEVIIPAITFVSTAHIVSLLGAKPVFCDVKADTLLLDWDDVKSKITNKTKLIIPVLYAGQPILNPPDFGIPLLYDCAHATGSKFDVSGKTCCWSFHAVKNLATGDGGMLTTDDEEIYKEAIKLRWLGIDKGTWQRNKTNSYSWEYDVETIGYKFHGNDLLSSIGIVQLEKLEEAQKRRFEIVEFYNKSLSGIVETPEINPDSSFHLYVIRTKNRNELSSYLMNKGVSTGVHYKPINLYNCYGEYQPIPVAEKVWLDILTLPLYPTLKLTEVKFICEIIRKFKNES